MTTTTPDDLRVPTDQDYLDALVIADYMHLRHPLQRTDIILGLGDVGYNSAVKAASLWLELNAPRWEKLSKKNLGHLVYSGGEGRGSEGAVEKVEADVLEKIALDMGVPKYAIRKERKSKNLGENFEKTSMMLDDEGIYPRSATIVHMPTSGRRDDAAARKKWIRIPGGPFPVFNFQGADISHLSYFEDGWGGTKSSWYVISEMLGDFQRLDHFSRPGSEYQMPLEEPPPQIVQDAYHRLVGRGFTDVLRKDDQGRPFAVDFSRFAA